MPVKRAKRNTEFVKLGRLKTGDAFKYASVIYIALALSPDPFDVFCLNTATREIELLDEDESVKLIENWYVAEMFQEYTIRGKKLKEL